MENGSNILWLSDLAEKNGEEAEEEEESLKRCDRS